jgi:hypothetical protein
MELLGRSAHLLWTWHGSQHNWLELAKLCYLGPNSNRGFLLDVGKIACLLMRICLNPKDWKTGKERLEESMPLP